MVFSTQSAVHWYVIEKIRKKSFGRIYLSFGRVRYREDIIRKILKNNTGGVAVKNKSKD